MDEPTTNAPAPAPESAPAPVRKSRAVRTYAVKDLAIARLRKRGVKDRDIAARVTDEAKRVRGALRANFAAVAKNDATVRKAKSAPNDGRPWPTNMNQTTFDLIVNGRK